MSDANNQLDHAAFREQIAAALADGLTAAERSAFDTHAQSCDPCRAELEAMRQSEERMNAMFASAHPVAGLEDRIIQRLRTGAPSPWLRRGSSIRIHPAIRKVATGLAAAIVLGGFGYLATELVDKPNPRIAGDDALALAFEPAPSGFIDAKKVSQSSRSESLGQSATTPTEGATFNEKLAYNFQNPFPGTTAAGNAFRFGANADTSGRRVSNLSAISNGTKADEQTALGQWGLTARENTYWDKSALSLYSEGKTTQYGMVGGSGGPMPALRGSLVLTDGDKNSADKPVEAAPPAQPVEPVNDPAIAGVPIVPVQAPPQAGEAASSAKPQADSRKIIRNGQLEFEVDRFDAAFAQVSKLTTEAGGYVGTTDSEKLPNGKVKGSVIVRVPPDRLDTLVLQLRGIGDLKSQKLEAQDVSKHYSDMDSQLKAARAMEERLIAIIKEGKGQIKDLLAAEKELGNWRTRIEQLVGEMKYYDNLVSLSTLTITLYERDIKTPATAYETETMDAGVEADDVEKARADALKAIEEAKGRVIQSDLKRYDAGQFGATIVAEVPPDQAGQLLDRLKQLGKMARLDVQRKQTSDANAQTAPLRVEKRDTRLNLSMYNLANVAPRQTTRLDLAADDVEAAYRAILARVVKANGRIVTSNLNQGQPDATSAIVSLEVPSAEADAVLTDIKAHGTAIKLVATENPDVQNSTSAKRGINVSIGPSASIPPRETTTLMVELSDVEAAMRKVLSTEAAAKGRILESNLSKDRDGRSTAKVVIEVPQSLAADLLQQVGTQGTIRSIQSSKNLQVPDGAIARTRIDITFGNADAIVAPDRGVLASIRRGFSTSIAGLMWSLQLVVMGVCFVLPFVLVIGLVWKLLKRRTPTSSAQS